MRLGLLLSWLLILPLARSEEVVLKDGERVTATIRFAGERLHYRRAESVQDIPLSEIVEVCFSPPPSPPPPTTQVRVGLEARQRVTGELLSLNDQRLQMHTPWTEKLTLERRGVINVTRPDALSVLEVQRHDLADPGQDELWLASGDQVCGHILSADHEQVAWRAGDLQRRTPWTTLRGLFFQYRAPVEETARGLQVEVGLAGWDREPDLLSGVLRGLDAKTCILEHRVLGELKLPRRYLSWIRPVFLGTRIELENGWRHLGPRARLEPRLQPPRSAGLSWQRTFSLRQLPAQATVHLQVRGLRGRNDGERERYERGELGTVLLLNERRVALLNLLVERTARTPTELSIALPVEQLRLGDNLLTIRQLAEPNTGQTERVGVGRIVLDALAE